MSNADIPPIVQLQAFVDFEREQSPELTHIAEWALNEIGLLREVHEAARQFLRYRGIDKERKDAALVRLANATEAVKDYDATS
jgi:hypothetical protein